MSEQTMAPPTYGPPTAPPGWQRPPAPRRRLRDRVLGFRSALAVGVAGLILGGAAGAGITAIAQGGGDEPQRGFGNRGGIGRPFGGQFGGQFGGGQPGSQSGGGQFGGQSGGGQFGGESGGGQLPGVPGGGSAQGSSGTAS